MFRSSFSLHRHARTRPHPSQGRRAGERATPEPTRTRTRPAATRWLLLAAILVLSGCELFVGELPEPVDTDDAGSHGTGGQSGAGGAAGQTGGAAATGGGAGACSAPCDCDGDGVEAKACGGADCDDGDDKVYLNEAVYFPTASGNAAIGFDYDCNGRLDRDPSLDKIADCSVFTALTCDTTVQGYFGSVPECGREGAWGTCKRGTVSCDPDSRGTRVMQCK